MIKGCNQRINGRQRMRLAMSRQETDRVPTMPQICHSHAVHVLEDDYRRGIAGIIENPKRQHELMLEIACRYGVDGLRLFILPEPLHIQDDGDHMIAIDPKSGRRVGRVDIMGGGHVVPDEPRLSVETVEDVKKICKADGKALLQSNAFCQLKEAIAEAHKLGFFVASSPPGFTVNALANYRGREQSLIDMAMNPDLVQAVMDVALDNAIGYAHALVESGVDALYIGDPMSSSSLISPQYFEHFCLPRFRCFCDELHSHDVLIYIHICGNTKPILEMMADTGVDCIEPLDPLGGVDIADAKRRVGHRVALMGGLNNLTLLEGSPEDVFEEAIACCRSGGKDGGYILAAGDMVPDLTPEKNVFAMVQAAAEYRYD